MHDHVIISRIRLLAVAVSPAKIGGMQGTLYKLMQSDVLHIDKC